MMKAYDLPNGLRLQFEEGQAPDGAVEHKCASRVAAKPAPKEEKTEIKAAPAKKAATPKNKKAPAKKNK